MVVPPALMKNLAGVLSFHLHSVPVRQILLPAFYGCGT